MKYLNYLSAILAIFLVCSCGSKKESNSESTEVDTSMELVSTEDIDEVSSEEENNAEAEVAEASSENAVELDELIASYSNFIDKYVSCIKKAKSGDITAMTDAVSLMNEAQELGDKIQNMKGDLSPAQLAKFEKLQKKLLDVAQ